jgi:hypothetical protein
MKNKKDLLKAINEINSLAEIDSFEDMLINLNHFEIISYKEYIVLLDALLEHKETLA